MLVRAEAARDRQRLRLHPGHVTGLQRRYLRHRVRCCKPSYMEHVKPVEIVGSQMYFEAVSRTGMTVDSGVIQRQGTPSSAQLQQPADVANRR